MSEKHEYTLKFDICTNEKLQGNVNMFYLVLIDNSDDENCVYWDYDDVKFEVITGKDSLYPDRIHIEGTAHISDNGIKYLNRMFKPDENMDFHEAWNEYFTRKRDFRLNFGVEDDTSKETKKSIETYVTSLLVTRGDGRKCYTLGNGPIDLYEGSSELTFENEAHAKKILSLLKKENAADADSYVFTLEDKVLKIQSSENSMLKSPYGVTWTLKYIKNNDEAFFNKVTFDVKGHWESCDGKKQIDVDSANDLSSVEPIIGYLPQEVGKALLKKWMDNLFKSFGIARKFVYLINVSSSYDFSNNQKVKTGFKALNVFKPDSYGYENIPSYSYGSIKDVLVYTKDADSFTAMYSTDKNITDLAAFRNDKFVNDLIRKMFISNIVYGESRMAKDFDKIIIEKIGRDGLYEQEIIGENWGAPKLMKSILNGEVRLSGSCGCSDKKVHDKIMRTPVSKYDTDTAMLFSYIAAEDKSFECEKLPYYWEAFNAMYSKCYAKLFASSDKNSKEFNKHRHFADFCGYGKFKVEDADKAERDKKERWIKSYVEKICKENITAKDSTSNIVKTVITKTAEFFKNENLDMDAESYLLFNFCYQTRCNLVHAQKPVALIAFNDDPLIKPIKAANALLESFVGANFKYWFTDEYETLDKNDASKLRQPEFKRIMPLEK